MRKFGSSSFFREFCWAIPQPHNTEQRGVCRAGAHLQLPSPPWSPSSPPQQNNDNIESYKLFSGEKKSLCLSRLPQLLTTGSQHTGFSHLSETAQFPPASVLAASERNEPKYSTSCNITPGCPFYPFHPWCQPSISSPAALPTGVQPKFSSPPTPGCRDHPAVTGWNISLASIAQQKG